MSAQDNRRWESSEIHEKGEFKSKREIVVWEWNKYIEVARPP